MWRLTLDRFMSDEQVEPAVAIEIQPGGALRGVKRKQTGGLGDIFERSIAAIPQERFGMPPLFPHPGSAQDEDVQVPVIVVVRRDKVQASDEACQTGLAGSLRKRAVAVVVI